MPKTVEEVLTEALDDEFRARATYRTVIDAYGEVRPFVNIVESEERHIQALRHHCERYGVKIPPDRWAAKVSAPESLEATCEAALEAERENGTLYERLIDSAAIAGRHDVEETFRPLMNVSHDNTCLLSNEPLRGNAGTGPTADPWARVGGDAIGAGGWPGRAGRSLEMSRWQSPDSDPPVPARADR